MKTPEGVVVADCCSPGRTRDRAVFMLQHRYANSLVGYLAMQERVPCTILTLHSNRERLDVESISVLISLLYVIPWLPLLSACLV